LIAGVVNRDGVPVIELSIAGRTWTAVIDTGFNGDLELPTALRSALSPRFIGRTRSFLAGGKYVDEDSFLVDFPFEGGVIRAEATFVPQAELLVGTHLLRNHRLEIDFVARTLTLRAAR
jgi:predicted aspartyl protease